MKPLHLLVALAAIPLAACEQQSPQARQMQASSRSPVESVARPGIAAKDGRLVLPAVKGRPGAAYFAIFNGTDTEVSITAVSIKGAGKAEMHRSQGGSMTKLDAVAIKPTWTQRFFPGARHVMAFDLDPKLAPGGKTEMTLTFANGEKFSLPLRIEAVGAAMEHEH